jgi:hypothetical protein
MEAIQVFSDAQEWTEPLKALALSPRFAKIDAIPDITLRHVHCGDVVEVMGEGRERRYVRTISQGSRTIHVLFATLNDEAGIAKTRETAEYFQANGIRAAWEVAGMVSLAIPMDMVGDRAVAIVAAAPHIANSDEILLDVSDWNIRFPEANDDDQAPG